MRPNTLIPLAIVALLSLPAAAQEASDATLSAGEGDATPLLADADASAEDPVEVDETVEVDDADVLAPRDAAGVTLDEFLWIARPIVVFADTPADPRFVEQMALLAERPDPLIERDVVIIVDTDPSARTAVRTALRPRGFSVVVLGKDGTVGLRRPAPRDVREIVRAIDNFQLRQEELRQGG
ncbi:DUF4174 domain-containing protein [Gymnodinialimonas ulvae]|uniref:DUF4174 domain-containing protein n=1 Tax=Gymnodinialimonas ulvae TaxID=3126504 RepID=UPI0030AE523A